MVGYSEVLIKVRRGVKGLRVAYIFSIEIVGEHPGIRLNEICAITGRNKSNMYESITRVIDSGFIYKENKRYYLTDTGRQVYDTVCREFDVSMNEIIRVLVEEAQRQV